MSVTQPTIFHCGKLALEGLWTPLGTSKAAVITHPHPMYGGDMHNPVVETISEAYRNCGWSTLRFNFRGTGASRGAFDNGKGEQKDVDAAIEHLCRQGITEIELAGYSYGAWVLARWSRNAAANTYPIRMVAPPVAFVDFAPNSPMPALRQVVVGTGDEFAPLGRVESMIRIWQPEVRFDVIEKADHFFWDRMDALQESLETAI